MAEVMEQNSSVQVLINRLRDDGVKAGQEQADRLLKDAKDKAAKILAEAKTEADKLLKQARAQIAEEQNHAHEALRVAVRNTELDLEAGVKRTFETYVKRLISQEMRDENFLRQLLLAIVGKAAEEIPPDQALEVLLPEKIFQPDAEMAQFTDAGRERLQLFVRRTTSEILRAGVTLKPASDLSGGIQVRLVDQQVKFDFSEKALTELILKHLLPRYRAIVEGAE